jgi:hypothetical protein
MRTPPLQSSKLTRTLAEFCLLIYRGPVVELFRNTVFSERDFGHDIDPVPGARSAPNGAPWPATDSDVDMALARLSPNGSGDSLPDEAIIIWRLPVPQRQSQP